jgi:hypothetical protein
MHITLKLMPSLLAGARLLGLLPNVTGQMTRTKHV